MPTPAIPIGELSRRAGCNIETIRYYVRVGVLPVARRSGRYRSYGPEDVSRLGFVRRARELGFTLDGVRALLALASDGDSSCVEARDLAASHLKEVRARIADLKRMERVLTGIVGACDIRSDAGCPLIDAIVHGARERARLRPHRRSIGA